MPIYVYKCGSCGKVTEKLQKFSDPLLTVCPSCGVEALRKQVTAAGFELKGSGWYVTDFRNEGGAPKGGDKETNVPSHSAAGKGTASADGASSAKQSDAAPKKAESASQPASTSTSTSSTAPAAP